MDVRKIDKEVLKSIIREIIKEDRGLFKEVFKEVLIENQVIVTKEQTKIERLIDTNFDKYDEVFKVLA